MPYNAAKAVAATFCYNIRYALTPIFGLDFLSLCVKPTEEGYGHMVIDRSIVHSCTEEANEYRTMSREGSLAGSPATPPSTTFSRWSSKSLRLKPAKIIDAESGYGTDTDRSDKYLHSPQSSSRWIDLSTPRSAPLPECKLSSPKGSVTGTSDTGGYEAPPNSPENPTSCESGTNTAFPKNSTDDDYDERSLSGRSSEEAVTPMPRKRNSNALISETNAALLLMNLHKADASLCVGGSKSKRRRASA